MIQVVRELHETPEAVQRRLQIAGGNNRFGMPVYRAVWGWNRLDWVGGKFEDRDQNGDLIREVVQLRREPKYPQVNRWHIERWCPPEAYGSERMWYAQTMETENGEKVPALGPYPERGDYEHCFTLETPKGEFVQLTATIAERVASAIEYSRKAPRSKRRAAMFGSAEREEKNYEEWAYDLLSDAGPAFSGQTFVTV